MYDAVYNTLLDLCEDICRRYGKTKLVFFDDKDYSLSYVVKEDEMLITVHRWFVLNHVRATGFIAVYLRC